MDRQCLPRREASGPSQSQRLSGDDEEQQHCTGDEHGAHSEAPCLRRVETAGQREEDRQHAERIEHDEQRHELVEESLHQ